MRHPVGSCIFKSGRITRLILRDAKECLVQLNWRHQKRRVVLGDLTGTVVYSGTGSEYSEGAESILETCKGLWTLEIIFSWI
jgi:hypothetical protein